MFFTILDRIAHYNIIQYYYLLCICYITFFAGKEEEDGREKQIWGIRRTIYRYYLSIVSYEEIKIL